MNHSPTEPTPHAVRRRTPFASQQIDTCGMQHLDEVLGSIARAAETDRDLCVAIHDFVRDHITFRFTAGFESISPSDTLFCGAGHCNPQADLFRELLTRAGFQARLRFVLLDKRILRHAIPHVIYLLVPRRLHHAVTELYLNNQWQAVDSYIFDKKTFTRQMNRLATTTLHCGFGLHRDSVCEWRGTGDALSQAYASSLTEHDERFADLKQASAAQSNTNRILGIHMNQWHRLIPSKLSSVYEAYINRLL